MKKNFKELLKNVKCFVFDIDGVLTDGSLHILEDGTMLRKMDIKDGYALQLAQKKGYHIFVISGSNAIGVKIRLENLGLSEVHLKCGDKLTLLKSLLEKYSLSFDDVIYMGDDMPDLDPMKYVAIPTCPSDAVHQIKSQSIFISQKDGGKGCVRDIIEQVLTLHGKFE